MITLSFFTSLWIAFGVIAVASLGVFFARTFKTLFAASALALTGICVQIFGVDIFRSSASGQLIIALLLILFLTTAVGFHFLLNLKPSKNIPPLLFGLPFLAFITMAISLDLLTFLLGLTLFNLTFLLLAILRGKDAKLILSAMQKSMVAFLGYSYGIAILFAREGTVALQSLHLKLAKGNWDNWTTLGVGLLVLSIAIELYAIFPLLSTKKKK